MGLSIKSKNRVQELKTGVHLVIIFKTIPILNSDGTRKVTENGELGIRIRFMNNDTKFVFDNDYWLGVEEREFPFMSMCKAAKINVENPLFNEESKGKRLWICIREVWKIDGEDTVIDDLTGEPDITYQIFKVLPFEESGKKPHVPGDPELHPKKVATGDFVDYVNVGPSATPPQTQPTQPEPKKESSGDIDWDDF